MSVEEVRSDLFDDHKAPDALRTIGEVARALDIRQHVLRYWEEQFPDLRPIKRSGGRRYYRPEDVQLIGTINRLVHHEGYTLRGARQALADMQKTPDDSGHAGSLSASDRARIQAIRDELAAALKAA